MDCEIPVEDEDLVVVVPDKHPEDDIKIEPYPFRSEIPSCAFASRSSERRFQPYIQNACPSKKTMRSVKIIHSMKRSSSAPSLLSCQASVSMIKSFPVQNKITEDHRSWEITYRWIQSSILGRFMHSFSKTVHCHKNELKRKSAIDLAVVY